MKLSDFIAPIPKPLGILKDFHERKTRIRAHDEVEISRGIALNNLTN